MKPLGERLREAMQGEPLRLTRAEWLEVRVILIEDDRPLLDKLKEAGD